MVTEMISAWVIVAGTIGVLAFGVRKWIHDERERREEAERRREEAERRREEAERRREEAERKHREEIQRRYDMIMEEIRKRHDITMAEVSGLRAEVSGLKVAVEGLRERQREDREEQKKENATVNRKVDAMGERLTRLESEFVTFRDIVMSHVLPAGKVPG